MKKYNVILVIHNEESSTVNFTEVFNISVEAQTPSTVTQQALAQVGRTQATKYKITITEVGDVNV
jgi:hypothetical protein